MASRDVTALYWDEIERKNQIREREKYKEISDKARSRYEPFGFTEVSFVGYKALGKILEEKIIEGYTSFIIERQDVAAPGLTDHFPETGVVVYMKPETRLTPYLEGELERRKERELERSR